MPSDFPYIPQTDEAKKHEQDEVQNWIDKDPENRTRDDYLVKHGHKPLTVNESVFVTEYVWGDKKGDAVHAYKVAHNLKRADGLTRLKAGTMLNHPSVAFAIKQEIDMYKGLYMAEKIKNIETLINIRDEMSTIELLDRWGNVRNPASCRTVAVAAAKQLDESLGLHVENGDSVDTTPSVNFNIVVPK